MTAPSLQTAARVLFPRAVPCCEASSSGWQAACLVSRKGGKFTLDGWTGNICVGTLWARLKVLFLGCHTHGLLQW